MKNKYIYFIAFLLFYSCAHKKDNIKSIVVKNWKGTFYLSEGIQRVYKTRKTPYEKDTIKEVPFKVSNKIINKIKRIYYDNDLENLPNQHELNSTNKDSIHPPQEATQIIFYFQDGKKKYITFWDDGYNNPLDRFPDKKIKPIFEEVTQLTKRISDSTGEKTIVPR